jgi:hypothetical protein
MFATDHSGMMMSAALSPLSSELAAVSRTIEGVGCEYQFHIISKTPNRLMSSPVSLSIYIVAHVYGAFNFVYGIGAASKLVHYFHYIVYHMHMELITL